MPSVVRPMMFSLAVFTAVSFGAGERAAAQEATPAAPVAPAAPAAAAPKLVGPIPARAKPGDASHDYTFLTPKEDLAEYGYVEHEYFLEGTANRYDTTGGTNARVTSSGHAYRTRIVVRRPLAARAFNGTVLLEWQNVTAGYDIDAHWTPSWEHFVKNGYVWVGVSAQRVGVHGNTAAPPPAGTTAPAIPPSNNGLKSWSPTRYGTLDVTDGGKVTDDALCYDIFSHAAQVIRKPGEVDALGGLKPREIIAVGASQSAGRLSIYHNAIHPLHEAVDAYYLLVGGSSLRTDLKVKVFQYLSETDVAPTRRMADSDHFRSWEVAGSAHSSYVSDVYRGPLIKRDFGGEVWPPECDKPPYSRVRGYHVINAQYEHLVRWLRDDIAPPTAPKIAFTSATPPAIDRDENGLAKGGIRLPEIAVPTALNQGINSGTTFCRLYGTYQPYDVAKLQSLYTDHETYARAVAEVAKKNAQAGYVLPSAAWQMTVDAAVSDVPFRVNDL